MEYRCGMFRFVTFAVVMVVAGTLPQASGGQPGGTQVDAEGRVRQEFSSDFTVTDVVSALGTGVFGLARTGLERVLEVSLDMQVQFRLDSAELTPVARQQLDVVAAGLNDQSLAGVPLTLEGHTDSSGSDEYNWRLSQRRANAVLEYLVFPGRVDRSRLQAVAFGESRPKSDYAPADPRQRRVEIVRKF